MLSRRVARRTPCLIAAAAATFGVLMPSAAQADGTQVTGGAPGAVVAPAAPAKPAQVTQSDIPTRAPADLAPAPKSAQDHDGHGHTGDETIVAELKSTDLKPFAMLGVTWEGGLDESDTYVEARWRADGEWSAWTELHTDPAPEEGGRAGTEPQWVGSADAAQVRVASAGDAKPRGLSLSTIDPEADADDSTASAVSPAVAVRQAATVAKPSIVSRASWGASSSSGCDSPIYGKTTRGAVIHHTAGNNTYTKAQSKAIVKATQAYHMKSRNWCDIGYNFLVDKYGQIFEGRAGGTTKPVRAAHSGNDAVNQETMGVSLMGTFSTTKPSDAMKSAVTDLVAWRFASYGLKAKGTYSLGGKTLNRIAGHRNVVGTECPGNAAYAWLSEKGGLRDSVESKLATGTVTAEVSGRVVSDVTTTGFTLAWRAASGAATYQVQTSTSSTRPTTCGTGCITQKATASPTATVEGLKAGATTYVWVRAVDASGSATTAWQVTPKKVELKAVTVARPAAVTGVTVSAGSHSARIRWAAVSGATGYDVCLLATKTSTSCAEWVDVGTSTTTLLSNLTSRSGTDYYVKVRAANSAGSGSWSSLKGFDLTTATPSVGNTASVSSSGKIAISGHGYGHGIGMSQYGAQGAARKGVSYSKILSTYYPGTKLASKSGNIRVLISQDTTDAVDVVAGSGLVFRKLSSSFKAALPTTIGGAKVTTWRIVQVSSRKTQSTLQYRTTGGYASYKGIRWTGDGQLEGPSRIALVMPNGSTVKYRGAIRSALPSKGSTARDTVNVLPIDHYVRGVIAAEMPSGWEAEALKAQAVAARTYGVRSITSSRYYDICSTTACQVYGGASRETASTDAAVRATGGKILTYGGTPAFTQFSSSSGGYTAKGSQPYLKAVSDPYDNWSGNANHAWTTTVAASTIQRAYPSIGTLKQLKVTQRTGAGDWGGRVTSISLVGSSRTVSISGDDARWAFGLKSNWFRFP
ncbi:SpoIID/LytB domain-containing protein [Aeromicrobium stalagmiti]|uniref:SpoIID/LytB domain-containing protein n=1 Tax=Aeromicrobium stalagmiti TaxID=2738988 RepID=UPI0015697FF2|nr:SpoIID/LytB domain-containing protein [Aeromicrobium stalagmiti]NRQ49880.1 SpoIID/LytB domain-containing protein [Aeromicrobium stalagmiti]